jgi:hypothetical protein
MPKIDIPSTDVENVFQVIEVKKVNSSWGKGSTVTDLLCHYDYCAIFQVYQLILQV